MNKVFGDSRGLQSAGLGFARSICVEELPFCPGSEYHLGGSEAAAAGAERLRAGAVG